MSGAGKIATFCATPPLFVAVQSGPKMVQIHGGRRVGRGACPECRVARIPKFTIPLCGGLGGPGIALPPISEPRWSGAAAGRAVLPRACVRRDATCGLGPPPPSLPSGSGCPLVDRIPGEPLCFSERCLTGWRLPHEPELLIGETGNDHNDLNPEVADLLAEEVHDVLPLV
jgi:hypothetical protein